MTESHDDMNALLRKARGVAITEPKTKRDREEQNEDMNARLAAARGLTVEIDAQK
jgi:hypothetical protein